MKCSYLEKVERVASEKELSIEDATRYLALIRCMNANGKKSDSPYEIISI
jgi:hypothetical protein